MPTPLLDQNPGYHAILSTHEAFMFSRNLTEVLLNTQQLEFFAEFLKERKADSALQFLVAVQKMSTEADEKICKSIIESIMKTFFHSKLPPGTQPLLLILLASPFSILEGSGKEPVLSESPERA